MPRRSSEASIVERTCLRDGPRPFGPGVMAPLTFVATTTSPREISLRSSRPVATSLAPCEYTSAVSKNARRSRCSGLDTTKWP
jgi:hypothetical protein